MTTQAPKGRSKRAKLGTMIIITGLGVATAFAIINAINESALGSTSGLIWGLLTGIPLVLIVVIGMALIFGNRRHRVS